MSRRAEQPRMRGGALSELLAAFRVRRGVQGNNGVSGGTAKQALGDQRDIGHHRHVAMIRSGVDRVFSAQYLLARGLDAAEAAEHNELVVEAVDAVLTRWDAFASRSNAMTPPSDGVADMLKLDAGFSVELA